MSHDDEHQLLRRAERDQFAYYLTLAYLTVDPSDWPTDGLHAAALAISRSVSQPRTSIL